MGSFAGKTAVVTGAASGIGQALAIELARRGAGLAISDVDTGGLAVTEQRLKVIGAPVKSDRLDVTDRAAFLAYADDVQMHFGSVNQIYNNAGIAFMGDVEITTFDDLERARDGSRIHAAAWSDQQVAAASDALDRSVAQRVFVEERTCDKPRIGAVLHLRAHIGQRGSVEHAGHFVERQHL